MTRGWKFLLAGLLLGVIVGGGAAWWAGAYGFCAKGPDPYAKILERFNRKLDLTPEQRETIKATLEENREKIKTLRTEVRPRFEEIRAATRAQIRGQLTPEQQTKFDAMQAEWDAAWKKRR
jgi:hypothetical protein